MLTINKIAENDFQVLNDSKDDGHFKTEEQAQSYIDALGWYADNFDEWIEENTKFETGTQEPEPQAEPAEEISLGGQYTEGQEVEVDGATYIIEKAFYIDPETSDFLDDVNDVIVSPGWHANARRKSNG